MSVRRVRKIFLGILVFLLFVIVAAAVFVRFASDDVLRKIAGSKGSDSLGRTLAIDGPITFGWDWTSPSVHIEHLRMANMPGSKDPNMVEIDAIDFHIKIWNLLEGQLNFPDITLTKPIIILEKRDANTANWDFPTFSQANTAAKAALPDKRSNFPVLGLMTINDGKLVYRDLTKKISLALDINTISGGGGEKGAFTLNGKGTLEGKEFEIKAEGGSLDMLRNSDAKYPLDLSFKMGATMAVIKGTFEDPVKLEGIDTTLELKGDNLADLFYLTLIPLPPTPPYKLSGHLLKRGDLWTFENLEGKVGGSDLSGNLTYDLSRERNVLEADLHSSLLDMKDLGGLIGAPDDKNGKTKTPGDSDKIIPDVPIDLTRLRASDMDVRLKAEKVLAPGLPMNALDIRFNLKDGVLRLDPMDFDIASGKITGAMVLDGRQDLPQVDADLSIAKLSLKQFFAGTRFAPLTHGAFGGHFKLAGSGKSLAAVLADSNGRVTFVMDGGTVSQLIVDGAGLDVGRAVPLLIGGDEPTNIRCAVGDFGVKDGILDSQIFVFDTEQANIGGEAHINLKDETIDAKISSDPKKISVTAHMPITISGPLKKPNVGVDVKEAAGRGAGAAVLSIFLTPLAAIVPFIEAGLGDDSDCEGLIDMARQQQRSASPAPAKP